MLPPLAEIVRPQTLTEFVGQKHLVGPQGILRKLIEVDKLVSMIFWGPPGSGKTTLARVMANTTKSHFVMFSAVTSNLDEVRRMVREARARLEAYNQKTILFIDEIHRFNKAQQDAFLPHVEKGTIILIGATTENPSFEVIGPLLSRCKVLLLERLTPQELSIICNRGLKELRIEINDDAKEFLVQMANGDARVVLNTLEIAKTISGGNLTLAVIQEALQSRLLYDRLGEEHYNTISAFIKSLRGSDPDAALYYLARMLEAGEDPLFIARRMVIFASEDVGNADPNALPLAVSVFASCERVGLPECQINLAQGVTYLACAPKSNASYKALLKASADVAKTLNEPIPLHLRNPVTPLVKRLGYGKTYKYPHEFPGHFVRETYLPKKLTGRKYYQPSQQGKEAEIKKRLEKLKEK